MAQIRLQALAHKASCFDEIRPTKGELRTEFDTRATEMWFGCNSS